MIVRVQKKHLSLGKPKKNKCPLSLACQDSFSLPWYCINVYPRVLLLKNFNGAIINSFKWPDIAWQFFDQYFDHFLLGYKFAKIPKPCKFDIGKRNHYGIIIDDVEDTIKQIRNWDGLQNET